MPAPLIPIAIAMAGRAAVTRYLASSAGAAAVKSAGSAGKAGKAAKGIKPKAIPKKVKGGSPAASTKSSGSPAGKPKKIKKPGAPGATWKYDPYIKSSGSSAGKRKTITNPGTGQEVPRSKFAQKSMAELKAANKKSIKGAYKSGKIKQPSLGPKGFKSSTPVTSRQTKVPKKKR
jgi:hypothetical protein